MLEINLLDIGVAVILLAFLVRGLVRGITREVGGLIGIVGGFALARYFQPSLQPTVETLFSDRDIAGVVAFLLVFLVTMIAVSLLVLALRRFMSITLTLWIDHFLGALAGLAKGLFIFTLLFFLVQGFFPGLALVEKAQATPFFDSMGNYLREFLPDSFSLTSKLPVRL